MNRFIVQGFINTIKYLPDACVVHIDDFKKGYKKPNGEIVDDKYFDASGINAKLVANVTKASDENPDEKISKLVPLVLKKRNCRLLLLSLILPFLIKSKRYSTQMT